MKLLAKKYLLIILFFLMIPVSYAGEAEKYFPLHVGDTWTYYHELYLQEELTSVDTVTVTVSEEKEIDGNTYYFLQGPEVFNNGYYRTEGNYVLRYTETYNYEWARFDVALRGEGSGEWYEDNYYGDYYIMDVDTGCASIRSDKKMDLPLGQLDGYYCNMCVMDSGGVYSIFLVQSIGIGYIHTGEGVDVMGGTENHYYLQHATIDGKDIVVAVESESEPIQFSLSSYPNPFNSSTTLSFSLANPGHVTMYVYNSAGQKVTTLVDSYMSAGEHSVVFDGEGLVSGIYYYRIETGEVVKTGRMTLVK